MSPGRSELEAEARYRLTADMELELEGLRSESLTTDEKIFSTNLSLGRQFGKFRGELGLRHTEQQNVADDDTIDSVRARLERSFSLAGRDGHGYAEWEQDISNTERRAARLGGEYQVHEKTKLYAEQELIDSMAGVTSLSTAVERSHTKIGVSTNYWPSTEGSRNTVCGVFPTAGKWRPPPVSATASTGGRVLKYPPRLNMCGHSKA